MIAWTIFHNPVSLNADPWTLWLVLPLCALVAIAYKTVRTQNLRRLWLEILALMGYIIFGLTALGFALWTIHSFFP